LVVAGILATARTAAGDEIVYATSITTGQIFSVDATTHVVTPVVNTGRDLDSLFFDPSGRIVYSELDNGTVAAYNPVTNTNVNLATGLTAPIDMALEPSGTSFLVSDSTSHLVRISLSGSGVINSLNVSTRPDGVIYDSSGRLFVNISTGFTANDSQVKQIDPTTGAVLHTSGNTGVFLDGLTYDSFTGMLFASDYNNGRILEINPNNLSSFTVLTPTGAALSDPDGITSDGQGNLFIASRANSHVIEYNIATNTATVVGTINGLDDLAPVSGLGAPTPEPSSMIIVVACTTITVGYRYGRKRLGRRS
jgi:sugar lactone lactonase YvrE